VALGLATWEYFAQHPEKAALCNESMTDHEKIAPAATLPHYRLVRIITSAPLRTVAAGNVAGKA